MEDLVATCVRLNLTKIILAVKIQLLRFQNELAAIYHIAMFPSCQLLLPQSISNMSKTNTSVMRRPTLTLHTPQSRQKGAAINLKEPSALLGIFFPKEKKKKRNSLTTCVSSD